jgi:hypothetical protein
MERLTAASVQEANGLRMGTEPLSLGMESL